MQTFNVILTIFLSLLTLLDCRMYLRRGWLLKLEVGVVCIAFWLAVCLQGLVRIKRTLKVRECKMPASVSCGADTEGDGKFEAGLCDFLVQ